MFSDLKQGMEPYVDWFGFMGYDLHGTWDADVVVLGSLVRGQTDIRDIYNDTQPLWFDDLDPSKINLGLAAYGRGYTLQSTSPIDCFAQTNSLESSCNTLLCPFTGPSKPAVCTQSAGVMSLLEIEGLIQEKSLKPTMLNEIMMKQITWDDQWIGYDDADTIAMKKAWGNNYCFGGTMTWSVDFNSGTLADLTPINTTDGTCGPNNGGAACGGGFGDCCSASGFCGSTLEYCGSGCSGGKCVVSLIRDPVGSTNVVRSAVSPLTALVERIITDSLVACGLRDPVVLPVAFVALGLLSAVLVANLDASRLLYPMAAPLDLPARTLLVTPMTGPKSIV